MGTKRENGKLENADTAKKLLHRNREVKLNTQQIPRGRGKKKKGRDAR